ncbi:MAG: glycosyltransferase family 4 protein [Acidaminococcaceae bacterium]
MRGKRLLTLFWYDDICQAHLYKDVGGVPYSLAKYCGWQTTFAYIADNGVLRDNSYEQYVTLSPIKPGKNNFARKWHLVQYLWQNISQYDVMNYYHDRKTGLLLALIAKLRKPSLKLYVKCDMGRGFYLTKIKPVEGVKNKIKAFFYNYFSQIIDLYSCETKQYLTELNQVKRFQNKIKYLPNGFFTDFAVNNEKMPKERIILTVGRIGAQEKNTELLLAALEKIDVNQLQHWQVYLVGTVTAEFREYLQAKFKVKPYLKDIIKMTGNITNKQELYRIYARSSIFILPSREESWGLVIPEAMYHENYVIVTDCCDAYAELLGQDEFGKIVPNYDAEALKTAIVDAMAGKVELKAVGLAAKEHVQRAFTWSILAQRLDGYLEEVLHQNK